MNINELIHELEQLRDKHGGDVTVMYIDPGRPEREVENATYFPEEKGGLKIWYEGQQEPPDIILPAMIRLS